MKKTIALTEDFDIKRSFSCGQIFGWIQEGEWFYGVIGKKPVRVRQKGSKLFFEGARPSTIKKFFSLDLNVQKINNDLSKDPSLKNAVGCAKGLRIIRQGAFECGVSFICATFANIPRIEKMLFCLRKRFGKKTRSFGKDFYLFPTPKSLAKAGLKELKACGLGYRAKYVKSFSEKFEQNKKELEGLKKKTYADAKKTLRQHDGIGEKVADCILLFSLDKTEAFPVDVWIKRAMANAFPHLKNKSNSALAEFGRNRWRKNAGIAQEYLYFFVRRSQKELKAKQLYKKLLQKYGPQGWWPLSGFRNNPTTGSVKGYHPSDYSFPKTSNQRFEICTGAILTQNTSWVQAEKALLNLKKIKALNPKSLNKTPLTKITRMIRPAGYFNQKAKKLKIFANFFLKLKGKTPSRKELLETWGIGEETADSMLLYAFKQPQFVVDAYTKRILERTKSVKKGASYAQAKHFFEQQLKPNTPLFQEFHALLVEHAKKCCKTKKPLCEKCHLNCNYLETREAK